MPFLSISLIKIFLVLLVSSHIAIAGPVPDLVGKDLSVVGREQASGGSVSSSRQAAGGDFLLLSDGDFIGRAGNEGHGGKAADPKKQESHNKGVGGSTLAGTRQKQGDAADLAGAFDELPQGGSEQGGSVNTGDSLLSLFSGNAGDGGGDRVAPSGLSILDILRKRNL